jgi:hypothetical protein
MYAKQAVWNLEIIPALRNRPRLRSVSAGRMQHNSDSCLADSFKVLPIKTSSHLKFQHQNDAQYTLDISEAVRKEPKIFTCLSVGRVLCYSWPTPYRTKRTWPCNRKHDFCVVFVSELYFETQSDVYVTQYVVYNVCR